MERALRRFEKALIDDVGVSALDDGEGVPFSLSAIIGKWEMWLERVGMRGSMMRMMKMMKLTIKTGKVGDAANAASVTGGPSFPPPPPPLYTYPKYSI
jgi:hypothetical protein